MRKPKCCKTCIHSRWWLTPTGRIIKDGAGRCVVPLPDFTKLLPSSVLKRYSYREPEAGLVQPDFGDDCALYQENPGKPISERNEK